MEAQLECPVCLTKYSTKSNRPKSLHCGHNICCECASGLLLKPKPACPLCLREIININSIDDLGDAWFIIDRLNFIELVCQNHPQELALYFNSQEISALCSQCSANSNPKDLIDLEMTDIGNYFINSAIDLQIQNPQKIPANQRQKFREISTKPNQDKLRLFKELLGLVKNICCDIHTKNNGILVNIENGEVLCENCPPQRNPSVLPIENTETFSQMLKNINSHISRVHYARINSDLKLMLKEFPRKSIEEKIFLLKKIKTIHIETNEEKGKLLSPLCILCDKEFNLSNKRPKLLSCPATHLICQDCSQFLKSTTNAVTCPLDSIITPPHILQDIFTENLSPGTCFTCQEFFEGNLRLPMILPCGSLCCSLCIENRFPGGAGPCFFCNETHENVFPSPRIKSQLISQIIELSVVYCNTHQNSVAYYIDTEELIGLCRQCGQGRNKQQIIGSDFNLAEFLARECFKQGNDLGNKLNPKISKELSEVRNLGNIAKIQLIKEIKRIKAGQPLILPSPMVQGPGNFKGRAIAPVNFPNLNVLNRFRSILPPENIKGIIPPPLKAWFIDKKKNQVEAVSFKTNREIEIFGVGISGPSKPDLTGKIEFFSIIRGENLGGPIELRDLEHRDFQNNSIVEDFFFARPIAIHPNESYSFLFKIDAEQVFRGNPTDRLEVQQGLDGVLFEFFEPRNKAGYFLNGQLFISGPLIRIIYRIL